LDAADNAGIVAVGTLVIWAGCLVVGLLGLHLAYPWPHPPPKVPEPVAAQVMHVDLTDAAIAQPTSGAPAEAAPDAAEPAPAADAPPAAPPLTAVAAPSAAIAFALPVEGPTRIVSAAEAVPQAARKSDAPPINAASPVRRITYGQGEGRQPRPEYPREAVLARQQGTVVVRFTVDQNGRVETAEAAKPSPYPLLNQSAVREIRENWRFAPGPPRIYEVAIEFSLTQR
jgi:TonB family protein